MRQKGFTLIELMVAISVIAILGTFGIAGFSNYNKAQVLQTSANEVVTMLNLAKSRAQSQIKPSTICTDGRLSGYKVKTTSRTYSLYLSCLIGVDNAVDIQIAEQKDKPLPTGLSFNANYSFFFPVQKGGVQASGSEPWQIVISTTDGKTKIIKVDSLGGVSAQ